jgi:biotin transport system substrate-specific component
MPPAPLAAWLAGRPAILRALVVLLASWLLAASSWAAIPLGPVPITLQTYAVLTLSALAGPRLALEIVLVWLLQAAIGLPVLADGAGGVRALTGPTAGFLAGFLAAAVIVGALARRPSLTGWAGLIGLFLAAHVLILALGWGWLALRIGPGPAWTGGVEPFLPGALVKSVLAAATVRLVSKTLARP